MLLRRVIHGISKAVVRSPRELNEDVFSEFSHLPLEGFGVGFWIYSSYCLHLCMLNSIERAANALLKDAATLLIYQEVFRSAPAQAFLKVLLALRRGDGE